MTDLIHGHEILNHLAECDAPQPVEALKQKFGANSRFTNCKGNEFSFDELITFLHQRGKIALTPEGITVYKEKICND